MITCVIQFCLLFRLLLFVVYFHPKFKLKRHSLLSRPRPKWKTLFLLHVLLLNKWMLTTCMCTWKNFQLKAVASKLYPRATVHLQNITINSFLSRFFLFIICIIKTTLHLFILLLLLLLFFPFLKLLSSRSEKKPPYFFYSRFTFKLTQLSMLKLLQSLNEWYNSTARPFVH